MHRRGHRARTRRCRFGLNLTSFFGGALFAAPIALIALRAGSLSKSGAVAAFIVGTLTYGAGGWSFTLILLAFFIPSVALSRVGRSRKKILVDIGKGGARDAWQVLANGGVATICAVVAAVLLGSAEFLADHGIVIGPNPIAVISHWRELWIVAFAGSYAAATADTWGTEIGTLVRGKPHSILTLRPIATGLSGGVTLAGSAAEIAGAIWIAATVALCLPLLGMWPKTPSLTATFAHVIVPVSIGGVAGALVDSLLGATLQELRRCPACDRTCETNPHMCGTPTVRVRGVRGFSNDLVNFGATLTGAAVALLLAAW